VGRFVLFGRMNVVSVPLGLKVLRHISVVMVFVVVSSLRSRVDRLFRQMLVWVFVSLLGVSASGDGVDFGIPKLVDVDRWSTVGSCCGCTVDTNVHLLSSVRSPSHAAQVVVPSSIHCFQQVVWKVCLQLARTTSSLCLKSSKQNWHVISLLVCNLGSWYLLMASAGGVLEVVGRFPVCPRLSSCSCIFSVDFRSSACTLASRIFSVATKLVSSPNRESLNSDVCNVPLGASRVLSSS
jgi:hypothetical protein